MILSSTPPNQVKTGKIVGISAGRYVVSIKRGTVIAYGSGYRVGDSVVLSKVNKSYSIISHHRGLSRSPVKTVYIKG